MNDDLIGMLIVIIWVVMGIGIFLLLFIPLLGGIP